MPKESFPNYESLPHEQARSALEAAICGTALRLADEAALFDSAPAGLMIDDVDNLDERFARVLALSSPTFTEDQVMQEGDMETNIVLMRVDLSERKVCDTLSAGVRMVQGNGIEAMWNREPEREDMIEIDKLLVELRSGSELDPATRSVVSEHMLDELRELYPQPRHLALAESGPAPLDMEVAEALDNFLEGPREGDPAAYVEKFYKHAGGRFLIAISSIDLAEGPEVTVEVCNIRSWEYDALRYVQDGHSDGPSFTFTDENLQAMLLKFLTSEMTPEQIAKHEFQSARNRITGLPLVG